MTKKERQANQDTAKALLKALDKYSTRGEKVAVASDIAWAAADQALTPEEVVDEGIDSGARYLEALADLTADIESDFSSQGGELAKRWRSIRAKVIKSIL